LYDAEHDLSVIAKFLVEFLHCQYFPVLWYIWHLLLPTFTTECHIISITQGREALCNYCSTVDFYWSDFDWTNNCCWSPGHFQLLETLSPVDNAIFVCRWNF